MKTCMYSACYCSDMQSCVFCELVEGSDGSAWIFISTDRKDTSICKTNDTLLLNVLKQCVCTAKGKRFKRKTISLGLSCWSYSSWYHPLYKSLLSWLLHEVILPGSIEWVEIASSFSFVTTCTGSLSAPAANCKHKTEYGERFNGGVMKYSVIRKERRHKVRMCPSGQHPRFYVP